MLRAAKRARINASRGEDLFTEYRRRDYPVPPTQTESTLLVNYDPAFFSPEPRGYASYDTNTKPAVFVPSDTATEDEEVIVLRPLTSPDGWRPILENGFRTGRTLTQLWMCDIAPLVGVPFPMGDATLSLGARAEASRRLNAFGEALWLFVECERRRMQTEPAAWVKWRLLLQDIRECSPIVISIVFGCIEAALRRHDGQFSLTH